MVLRPLAARGEVVVKAYGETVSLGMQLMGRGLLLACPTSVRHGSLTRKRRERRRKQAERQGKKMQ